MAQENLGERFMEVLKGRILPEIGAEAKRLGTQGSMEIASLLFNGHGFVPYGPGQYTPSVDEAAKGQEQEVHPESQEQEQHRGRSM